MPQLLLTDWLTICTAGPTIDGRTIEEQWLTDAAATYDREDYPAVIDVEHWYGNLGSVYALRTQRDAKKRLVLQARLRPNKYMLSQNAEGLRLRYSAHFIHDFAGSGKTYLFKLATTDTPASLGTTQTQFAAKPDLVQTDPVELGIDLQHISDPPLYEQLVQAVKEMFTGNNKQEKKMNKEEFSALMKPYADQMTELAGKVDELGKKIPVAAAQEPPAAPKADEFNAKEEFATLKSSVTELAAKLEEALRDIPPKGNAAGTGDEGEAEDLI